MAAGVESGNAKSSPRASEEQGKETFMHITMTSTAFNIDGYRTVKTLGLVRGITVRSRSIFGTIGGSLQTLFGGNISLFTNLCEKTRSEAFELMLQHAEDIGANAIIGVRYDATEVMQGVSEVLCYGTAVLVEKIDEPSEARATAFARAPGQ
jgi:uncharacterized protein YbjQ (UPF0145 family)